MTAALEKPAFGSPCNGCGICCILEQCPLSEIIFGELDHCPALEAEISDPVKYRCGLLRDPAGYLGAPTWAVPLWQEATAILLGAGAGCDAVEDEAESLAAEAVRPAMRAHMARSWDGASPEAKMILRSLGGMRPGSGS